MQSKIRQNIYENVKLWKYIVSIFFTFYCKPSCMAAERQKLLWCLLSVYSMRQLFPNEEASFSKLHGKCCQNLINSRGITNIPFYDAITKIWFFFFFFFCYFSLKYESRITDKEQKKEQIFNKGEFWRRSGKAKQVDAKQVDGILKILLLSSYYIKLFRLVIK